MKKFLTFLIVGVVAIGAVAWLSGGDESSVDNEQEEVDRNELSGTATYAVMSGETELEWTGTKTLIADYEDTGTVEVASGTVTVSDGNVTAAEVVVDMNTIAVDSTDNENQPPSRLETHLKSGDFFGVEEFPTATLVVTEVSDPTPTPGVLAGRFKKQVTADLTIKGQTHEIVFPATVYETDNNQLIVDAELTVDRSRYNVRFGSSSFFDDLGDSVIGDNFTLDVHLVATPEEQSVTGENEEGTTSPVAN